MKQIKLFEKTNNYQKTWLVFCKENYYNIYDHRPKILCRYVCWIGLKIEEYKKINNLTKTDIIPTKLFHDWIQKG
jgi:hypothetical protein